MHVIFRFPREKGDENGIAASALAGTNFVQSPAPTDGSLTVEATGNVIDGGAGNDEIDAGSGADVVHGGDDDDVIRGMGDDDVLFGDAGADEIHGDGTPFNYMNYTPAAYHGDDVLVGGAGNDTPIDDAGPRRIVSDRGRPFVCAVAPSRMRCHFA